MKTEFEQEVMDRIIRIESRMVQLGDHVGANLRAKQRITVEDAGGGNFAVHIDALDVSLSRIRTELTGYGAKCSVPVYHQAHLVMTVHP